MTTTEPATPPKWLTNKKGSKTPPVETDLIPRVETPRNWRVLSYCNDCGKLARITEKKHTDEPVMLAKLYFKRTFIMRLKGPESRKTLSELAAQYNATNKTPQLHQECYADYAEGTRQKLMAGA